MPMNVDAVKQKVGDKNGGKPSDSAPQSATPKPPNTKTVPEADKGAIANKAAAMGDQTNTALTTLVNSRTEAKGQVVEALTQLLDPKLFWDECLNEAMEKLGQAGESQPQAEDWGFGDFQVTVEVPRLLSVRERLALPSSEPQ